MKITVNNREVKNPAARAAIVLAVFPIVVGILVMVGIFVVILLPLIFILLIPLLVLGAIVGRRINS